MDEKILEEAQRRISGCDYIVDLFDLKYVWASEHASLVIGFSVEEILEKRVLDLVVENESAYRKELLERMIKGQGVAELVIRRKDGVNVSLTIQYCMFEMDGGQYSVGKITASREV